MGNRALNFITGTLLGGLVGAVAVILLTPTSGEELRGQIQIQIENVRSEVKAASDARRAELEAELASLRKPKTPDDEIIL